MDHFEEKVRMFGNQFCEYSQIRVEIGLFTAEFLGLLFLPHLYMDMVLSITAAL